MITAVVVTGFGLAVVAIVLLASSRPRIVPVPVPAPDAVSRRRFMSRVWTGALGMFAVTFAGGSVGMLWPNRTEGVGGRVDAGPLEDVVVALADGPVYVPAGRFYLVAYDTSDPDNRYVRAGVATDGMMAVYQRCAHLGCRVPFCHSSQWFECPCHGSKYNAAGEWTMGPATAGLWRFRIEVVDGHVIVDASEPTAQPARDVDTLRQPAAGAFCQAVEDG